MAPTSFLLAASSLAALSYGAPLPRTAAPSSLVERGTFSAYAAYGGNGEPTAGWPQQSSWQSFDTLFEMNRDLMKQSCAQFGVPDNSDEEIANIKDGLANAAQKSGVDQTFLLAVMMQESKGCVRAPTTNYGQNNPGLMQSFNGQASCNQGGVQTPCPKDTIFNMLLEGSGEGLSFGLKQAIAQSGASDVSKFYKGARIYNSGSVAQGGNLGEGIATHCYASDIANRLLGWTSQTSACSEGTIGSLTGSAGNAGNDNNDNENTPAPPPPANQNQDGNNSQNEEPAPTTPPTNANPPAPATSNASQPQAQPQPEYQPKPQPQTQAQAQNPYSGAAQGCTKWHSVVEGDACDAVASAEGIDFARLRELNAGLDATCSNLWKGYDYCVAV